MENPLRGEVWFADLNPVKGHEQRGLRPGLVVSADPFNKGPAGLVVILPLTSRKKNIPLHVEIVSPEGGLKRTSYAKCEDIRSVSKARLTKKIGAVSSETMASVESCLRRLLDI